MYIVTGGCGFIGSHLTEELVRKGFEVTVIDNLYSGRIENIRHLLNGVKFIEGRASRISEVKNKEVDGVFHLGIYSSSPMYKKDPSLVSKVVEDMIRLLSSVRRKNVNWFMHQLVRFTTGIPCLGEKTCLSTSLIITLKQDITVRGLLSYMKISME